VGVFDGLVAALRLKMIIAQLLEDLFQTPEKRLRNKKQFKK